MTHQTRLITSRVRTKLRSQILWVQLHVCVQRSVVQGVSRLMPSMFVKLSLPFNLAALLDVLLRRLYVTYSVHPPVSWQTMPSGPANCRSCLHHL